MHRLFVFLSINSQNCLSFQNNRFFQNCLILHLSHPYFISYRCVQLLYRSLWYNGGFDSCAQFVSSVALARVLLVFVFCHLVDCCFSLLSWQERIRTYFYPLLLVSLWPYIDVHAAMSTLAPMVMEKSSKQCHWGPTQHGRHDNICCDHDQEWSWSAANNASLLYLCYGMKVVHLLCLIVESVALVAAIFIFLGADTTWSTRQHLLRSWPRMVMISSN